VKAGAAAASGVEMKVQQATGTGCCTGLLEGACLEGTGASLESAEVVSSTRPCAQMDEFGTGKESGDVPVMDNGTRSAFGAGLGRGRHDLRSGRSTWEPCCWHRRGPC